MDKNIYFEEMRYTTEIVKPFIEKYLNLLKIKEIFPGIYEDVSYFYRLRKNNLFLKPFLIRLCYEQCGGNNWEKIASICAAYELINISSYQANSAFDDKLGINSLKEKQGQFIASMITREISEIIISENIDLSENTKLKLLDSISRANRYIYIAQYYDLEMLNVINFNKYADIKAFLSDYEKRCLYGSGIYSEECAYAGAVLANASDYEINNLREFAKIYGTVLHMVNDIGDFIPQNIGSPTINKYYQDSYSDLKHHKLTLPIYKYLKLNVSTNMDMIKRINNESVLSQVIKDILKSSILLDCKKYCVQRGKLAKKSLDKLNHSRSNDLLKMMYSSIESNKYYYYLKTK
jgi:geranylgeranyl pyrophosphate synthase